MDRSLLYVSECVLTPDQAEAEVGAIVDVSRSRNRLLDVTGALISTPMAFAQILEGSEAALAELMDSIRRDWRHRNVKVVATTVLHERRFKRWSMAYGGRSTYVFQFIRPLLAPRPRGRGFSDSQALAGLMEEFERSFE